MSGGPWRQAWTRLRRDRMAMAAAAILTAILLACLGGGWIAAFPPDEILWDHIGAGPDLAAGLPFGADQNGRDLLARTLAGGRLSLGVAAAAALVAMVLGLSWGAIAGFSGGRIDGAMMRVVDALYALPFMFFVILLASFFGQSVALMFVAIGAVEWLDMARIARGQTASLRRQPFVLAAQAIGASPPRILLRHILPNLAGVAVIGATLAAPRAVLVESFVSFLGLGVQEPDASWGVLIGDGARALESAPWTLVFPALFLGVTLLALNLLGDAVRDALDPRRR